MQIPSDLDKHINLTPTYPVLLLLEFMPKIFVKLSLTFLDPSKAKQIWKSK